MGENIPALCCSLDANRATHQIVASNAGTPRITNIMQNHANPLQTEPNLVMVFTMDVLVGCVDTLSSQRHTLRNAVCVTVHFSER